MCCTTPKLQGAGQEATVVKLEMQLSCEEQAELSGDISPSTGLAATSTLPDSDREGQATRCLPHVIWLAHGG